jgi:hypothetical protein
MGYGLDGLGSILDRGKNFSLLHSVRTGPWVHPASYPISTGGSFTGVKLPRLEADHSSQSNVKVKNGGAITPLSIYPYGVVHN